MSWLSVFSCLLWLTFSKAIKPVSFQVHSWNDLSLWPNGFKQHMTEIKIDAHFIDDPSLCLTQKQVIPDASHIENGCFLLSHDTPNTALRQYNSTDDVIQFIVDHIDLFRSSRLPITLAVCFKVDVTNVKGLFSFLAKGSFHPCDDSVLAMKWRNCTTQLMNNLTQLIASEQLTLNIVLDGYASYNHIDDNQCLAHLWEPYNKTFTGTPSNPIAQDDDAIPFGYNRFSILDTSVSDSVVDDECLQSFDAWRNVNFEKYNKSTQPWFWWEPSSQKCVRTLTNAYTESPFYHRAGFFFAINIDIPRFKIYAGYNACNEPLQITWDGSMHSTQSTVTDAWYDGSRSEYVVFMLVSDAATQRVWYNSGSASELVSGDVQIGNWRQLDGSSGLDGQQLTSMTRINDSLVGVGTQNGSLALFTLRSSAVNDELKIELLTHAQLTPKGTCRDVNASSIFVEQMAVDKFLLYQAFVCRDVNESVFAVQKWSLVLAGNSMQLEPVNVAIPIEFTTSADIDEVSIVNVDDDDGSMSLMLIVWSTIDRQIFGCLMTEMNNSDIRVLSVGNKPRLSKKGDTIVMVHQNGYCWLNEKRIKQSYPATCDQIQASSMDGVLSYSVANAADWYQKMMNYDGILSNCDEYIMHGMYDGGYNPFATILVDEDTTETAVVAVHSGLYTSDKGTNAADDLSVCGSPMYYNDLVLDSWIV